MGDKDLGELVLDQVRIFQKSPTFPVKRALYSNKRALYSIRGDLRLSITRAPYSIERAINFIKRTLRSCQTSRINYYPVYVVKNCQKGPASSVNYKRSKYVSQTLYVLSKQPIYDLCNM